MRALVAPAAAAAALLMTSGWLVDQRIGYVIAGMLATVAAIACGVRWSPHALRSPLYLTVAALGGALLAAGRAEFRLGQFERAPTAVSAM